MKRKRIIYAALILTVILLGLASRSRSVPLPLFVEEYAGDALWALAAYFAAGFLFPRLSIMKVAAVTALFCLAIELSQLYHAPWIDRLRQIRFAALFLGYGFLWSDLACYAAGIAAGAFLERLAARRRFFRPRAPVRPNERLAR